MNQVISTQGLLGCHPIKQLAPTPLETYSFFRALWWHNFFIQKMILLCFKPSKIHRVPEFTWITYFHRFGFPSSQFTNSRNRRGIAYFGVGSSWSTGPRHFRKISLGHLVLGFICPEPMLWKIRISWGATLQGPPPFRITWLWRMFPALRGVFVVQFTDLTLQAWLKLLGSSNNMRLRTANVVG